MALCLSAIERHFDGRRADAFLLGLGAALLRPEVWPFFGLYGLWLAWVEPRRRLLVLGAFAVNGVLWFAPEYWGSGDWLRAANRAHQPQPGLAGVRRAPVPGGVRALVDDPLAAGAAGVARRARQAGARAALGGPAVAVRRRGVPDDRRGADDRGRLRRQPALRRAPRRAPLCARRRRLGRARAGGGRTHRPRRRGRPGGRARRRGRAVRDLRPRASCATAPARPARRPRSTTRCPRRSPRPAGATRSSAARSTPAPTRCRPSPGTSSRTAARSASTRSRPAS